MKPIRWTPHALQNLADREIDRSVVEETLGQPELVASDPPDRKVLMRKFFDPMLQQQMLLRVVIEESADERVVVTLYKTSQIARYLPETPP